MRLRDLLAQVDCLQTSGDLDRDITAITQDSRRAGPGAVFVAVAGARVDGHDFVPGLGPVAAAVVAREVPAPPGVALVRVADTRLALAQLAAAFRGHPSRRLRLIGITGTNGKTTTAHLLEGIARAAGIPIGLIGTAGHRVAGRALSASYTTPEAPRWQELLAEMADAGCEWVAAEVSSIGLAARRVDATHFSAAVFTNLSRDHLDYHGDMARYTAAKARLFRELLPPGAPAIVPAEDPAVEGVIGDGPRVSWGLEAGEVRVEELELSPRGSRGVLCTPGGQAPFALQLVGRHNVANALAAAATAYALGLDAATIARGLAAVPCVAGRLERAGPAGAPVAVLVDYAHTDEALRTALRSLRGLGPGRLLVVFGCGGDRDRGKRPLMARAASEGADLVIVTSDNPRSEDALAIIEDMKPGLGPGALIEPDRALAIRRAITLAAPGDVVLIAGKGHEQYQEIAGVRHPFDDRRVAAAALEAL